MLEISDCIITNTATADRFGNRTGVVCVQVKQ